MKKIALGFVISALFAASAQAATADLSTWATNGDVSITSNFANLTAYSTIQSNVSNVTSFDWKFQANDYMPYNDYAWITLNGVTTTLSNVATVGDYGNSGWNTYTFAAPVSGTLQFGVANGLDDFNSSQLYIQNVSSVSAVPEPESYAMLLAGLGLMGFMVRRRKTS